MNWVYTSLSDYNIVLGHSICSTLNKAVFEARMMQLIYIPEVLHEDDCLDNGQNEKRERSNKKAELNFKLLPNPASEYGWLIHPSSDIGSRVLVFDINGIQLRSESLNSYSQKSILDLRGLSQGTYLLKVLDKGEVVFTNKIVKL